MEKIQLVVLESIKFDYPDESYEFDIFGIVRLSELHREKPNSKADIPVCFYKL